MTGFIRYGISQSTATEALDDLALGFTFTGLIPHRPEDQLGLAATRIRPSHD